MLAGACGGASTRPLPPPAALTFPSGDVRLSYALDLPAGPGPFPAIVFGHGSGRTTQDEAMPVKSRMTQAGFAVLRYDKRGVGESSGTYSKASASRTATRVLGELADDMAAGVAFLRTRPEIDQNRIGLMGISQAGWIMPLAAERAPGVRFMVLVVGPDGSGRCRDLLQRPGGGHDRAVRRCCRSACSSSRARPASTRGRTLERLDVPGLWLLGGQDRSIPRARPWLSSRSCPRAGRPYRWMVYPDSGHFIPPDDYIPEAVAFARSFR